MALRSRRGELVYQSGPRMRRVRVDKTAGFAVGVPETLFESSYLESRIDGRRYDLSPDGQWFAMLEEKQVRGEEDAGSPMVFVLDWAAEVQRLVPHQR